MRSRLPLLPFTVSAPYMPWPSMPLSVPFAAPTPSLYTYTTAYNHMGPLTYQNAQLKRIDTPNGFICDGETYYYIKDYQGNVRQVVDADGTVLQDNHYYPYGMLMAESSDILDANRSATSVGALNPYMFGSKEYLPFKGANLLDYSARFYDPATMTFGSPDPMRGDYLHLHSWLYCGANPVAFIDPNGCEIRGATKKDAALVVQDFREMFPGDEFAKFRELIVQSGKKQNGKSLATINSEALTEALSDISLNEDQEALMNIVVNTINSKDVHIVEFMSCNQRVLSGKAFDAFLPGFEDGDIAELLPLMLEVNGGIPIELIISSGGGGVTTPTSKGSYSIIILGGEHPNGRAVTTGHEILGHGRSSAVGIVDQHTEPIRTENLILRVMGIPFINNGANHGPETIIDQPSLLPSFR